MKPAPRLKGSAFLDGTAQSLAYLSQSAEPNELQYVWLEEEHLRIGTINAIHQLASASLTIAFTVRIFIALQEFIAHQAGQNPVIRIQLATAPT